MFSVSFLVYVTETNQVWEDPPKIQAATHFQKAAPVIYQNLELLLLKCLISPKGPFLWNSIAQEAFGKLKQSLASAPILAQPA